MNCSNSCSALLLVQIQLWLHEIVKEHFECVVLYNIWGKCVRHKYGWACWRRDNKICECWCWCWRRRHGTEFGHIRKADVVVVCWLKTFHSFNSPLQLTNLVFVLFDFPFGLAQFPFSNLQIRRKLRFCFRRFRNYLSSKILIIGLYKVELEKTIW